MGGHERLAFRQCQGLGCRDRSDGRGLVDGRHERRLLLPGRTGPDRPRKRVLLLGSTVLAAKPALPLEIHSYPGWVAFSPDKRLLAIELSPAVIHLVDSATGRTVAKLEDPRSDRAQWLGFTPDGSGLVAIASFSGAIHVWDLAAIRRYLAAMHLDWDSPPDSPTLDVDARRPLVVEPVLGDERRGASINTLRLAVESQPGSVTACNDRPGPTSRRRNTSPSRACRDPGREGHGLDPHHPTIRNTLGLAYYRVGRYRDAADTLRGNLTGQKENYLAVDLYVLAMSHHRLGEAALCGPTSPGPIRHRSEANLTDEEIQERAAFRGGGAAYEEVIRPTGPGSTRRRSVPPRDFDANAIDRSSRRRTNTTRNQPLLFSRRLLCRGDVGRIRLAECGVQGTGD